jgi:hypothetical protein
MCLAMNADRLEPGERCASTSNRNFEGRQGNGGRTHLVSPARWSATSSTSAASPGCGGRRHARCWPLSAATHARHGQDIKA